jgi:phage protein D
VSDRLAPVFFVSVRQEGRTEEERLDFDLTNRVLAFSYEDSEKKTDLLKLEVDNWDLANFDDPIWKPGNTLIVSWGYAGNMAPTRECVIQKVMGATKLTVEAQGKTVLINKETKSTTWPNRTRSSVVEELAIAAGYESEKVRFIEQTTEVFDTITQSRQTDAQFIKRLADLEGFEFFIDHSGFHWHPRRFDKAPIRVLQWYLPPDVGDVISFNVETDIFAKPAEVTTKGRDPLNKLPITATGADNATNRAALGPIAPIVGASASAAAVGAAIAAGGAAVSGLFSTAVASAMVLPTTETSIKQAKREADGAYRRSVQSTVKLTLELVGDPGIIAKSVVEVRGISKRLSGLYYVTDATHSISSSGYKLTLKCQSDGTHGHVEDIAKLSITESKASVNKQRGAADNGALIPFQVKNKDGTLGPITYVPADKVAGALEKVKQGRGADVGIVGAVATPKK